MSYKGRTVLVMGAARSGIAAARFLLDRGARVILTDSKPRGELEGALAPILERPRDLVLELGGHRPESFRSCDFVVISPGIPLSLPILDISRQSGIPVLAEVELGWRHLKGKTLGITGSNGKTTTTALVAELLKGSGLKGQAAGNIGAPLVGFAENSSEDDIYAVELSSFQLEGIRDFRPWIASILNLTPDHMDRYAGMEQYIAAKLRIFTNQQASDFALLNADDPRTAATAAGTRARLFNFSRLQEVAHGSFVRAGKVLFRDGSRERVLFPADAIPLKGAHNLENVLAASAIALLAGARAESLEASIRAFRAVEHRIEFVAAHRGVEYYNDSKATNVDATIKALEAFPGGILLIAGGRDKAGDFTLLRPLVRERVRHLVLIGEAAPKIREALSGAAAATDARSMQEAVAVCSRLAEPGDVVLLAPACASFDMFRDYEDRGRTFKEAVRELTRGKGADHGL